MMIANTGKAQTATASPENQTSYPGQPGISQDAGFFSPWQNADFLATADAELMQPASLRIPHADSLQTQSLQNPAAEDVDMASSSWGMAPIPVNAETPVTEEASTGTEARLVQYELISPTKLPANAIIDVADYEKVPPDRVGYQIYDASPGEYEHQLLPQGLIYRAYLAGEKESRLRGVWNYDYNQGWIWDITLGGRAGLYRYGSTINGHPVGFQVDIEGAGLVRLDLEENRDVDAADFRFGVPLTWGNEIHQVKFAYYHLSSHLGDEFMLKNPGYPRLNYSRDVLVLGHSYYMTDELRLYGEVGYAMYTDVALEWEFQFGIDYAPAISTGLRGAPFAALNAHLREEVNYGGNFVAQVGWAWRSSPSSGLFRIGIQYFNGENEQFSFYDHSENKTGLGIWYDY